MSNDAKGVVSYRTTTPEIWAGVECTVNRVAEKFFDQLERTGHADRLEDIHRLADLGIQTIRYPVLWERVAPERPDSPDWLWSDERLQTIRDRGLRPVVGLVHHGSGPRYTDLLDPSFPEKLSAYALKVAQRYPWVADYTPINEPLTTARFSCLYGYWYPHFSDALLFAQSFLNECRATVLAMRAIRTINSDARLIQTEDLGKTFSTPTLQYQADFENERRWLTFDLLCGRLNSQSPMWSHFRWLGIPTDQLEWFQDNFIEPEVLGINYYVTSERFLDERFNRYPSLFHGGNGKHLYADLEAVRVSSEGIAGTKAIIGEVWERYHLPIAITEVHLGCTREEQLRWVNEVWNAALESRQEQIDVRAITLWAAFGAFDWNSLLTAESGYYEPGMFDLRSPEPRPTALAKCAHRLAVGAEFDHPTLDSAGWWRRADRYCYAPVSSGLSRDETKLTRRWLRPRPILITGATGTLGSAFARICESRGLACVPVNRQQLDITSLESIESALEMYQPWAIINTAGYVRVDEAEIEVKQCYRDNVIGPDLLAKVCAANEVKLVTFSSDLVFDGLKSSAYVESDKTSPLSTYGASKVEAEQRVLEQEPGSLVVRTSAFFGPWDNHNFVHNVVATLHKGAKFTAIDDVVISPTYIPELINATLDLLIDNEAGVWHIANEGSVTWCEFARLVAVGAGYSESLIEGRPLEWFDFKAQRPAFSALASQRANLLPTFESALERFFREVDVHQPTLAAASA